MRAVSCETAAGNCCQKTLDEGPEKNKSNWSKAYTWAIIRWWLYFAKHLKIGKLINACPLCAYHKQMDKCNAQRCRYLYVVIVRLPDCVDNVCRKSSL